MSQTDEKPDEAAEQIPELADMTLEELPESLRDAAKLAGWDKLMPVQARAIPYLLKRRDVMVQARTGSGKTGAFVLPMLDRLDPKQASCQVLVLVPTRELAKQVAEQAELLGGARDLRVVAVYGGVKYNTQLEAFRKGAHIACINHGLFIAPRGMIALSTVIGNEHIVEAVERADMAMQDVAAEIGDDDV